MVGVTVGVTVGVKEGWEKQRVKVQSEGIGVPVAAGAASFLISCRCFVRELIRIIERKSNKFPIRKKIKVTFRLSIFNGMFD